jgi:hypothetical protein
LVALGRILTLPDDQHHLGRGIGATLYARNGGTSLGERRGGHYPRGWELNIEGRMVNPATDTVIDNPNDYWRSLPLGFQRGPLWNNAKQDIRDRLDDLIRKVLSNVSFR